MPNLDDDRGLFREVIGDGRPALTLTAVMLFLSGAFAVFLSVRREFLPHDVAFLGMTAEALCGIVECRIVRFMFHDRVAFGGTLISVAALYLWLASFPLRHGHAWAWWAFFGSGVLGFGQFPVLPRLRVLRQLARHGQSRIVAGVRHRARDVPVGRERAGYGLVGNG